MAHLQSQIGEVKVSHIYPKQGVKRVSEPKARWVAIIRKIAHDCAAERQI